MSDPQSKPLRVWDLPTRVFHWTLVALVVTSVVSVKAGNMDVHMLSGYSVLALLLFRLVWGFAGTAYARFSSFLHAPRTVLAYAHSLLRPPHEVHPGHNPLGGLMVIVMLAVLLFQAGTGLFANDDIVSEGPLAKFVSKALSDRLSSLHRLNEWVIYVLVGLHVAAVIGYLLKFRQNLVGPMFTGVKRVPAESRFIGIGGSRVGWALAVLALCAAGVWFVVEWL